MRKLMIMVAILSMLVAGAVQAQDTTECEPGFCTVADAAGVELCVPENPQRFAHKDSVRVTWVDQPEKARK